MLADVNLEPLADAEIAEIARHAGLADDSTIRTVVASADGNALLISEASPPRLLTSASPKVALTVRARATIAINSTACEVMAVAGRVVRLRSLRRAEAFVGPEFDAMFEAASDAGLLHIVDGTIDFRHALVREAYYADLPQLLRIRLHAAAARDLDENCGPELAGEAA